jgi:hypothetical protein
MIPRVKATRLTQPYRRGTRNPGPALTAMTKGRTYAGTNPQDLTRSVQKLIRAGGGRGTGPRPARPARPVRATLSRIDPPVQPKKIPLDALIERHARHGNWHGPGRYFPYGGWTTRRTTSTRI